MTTVNILQGQTAYIDPQLEYADSGWEVDGQYATHYPCFPGTMEYTPALPFEDGLQYDFTYEVDNYSSGGVRLILGSQLGTLRSAAGTYTETFTYSDGDMLKFYSDGFLRVILLNAAEHLAEPLENGDTFAFHEPSNRWVENYSWLSEMMLNFSSKFFSFRGGQLWEHETNPIAGSFYGTKYPSRITFVINAEYEKDKLWYNVRMDAKGQWYMPSITIPPSNQFPNGMTTRIKKNNVKRIDGKLWAAIMGDINDPNFALQSELNALFGGRKMQGGVLVVELECNDNEPGNIISAEFYYSDVERSF